MVRVSSGITIAYKNVVRPVSYKGTCMGVLVDCAFVYSVCKGVLMLEDWHEHTLTYTGYVQLNTPPIIFPELINNT